MEKLNIYVCENFSPEFSRVLENQGFEDVILKPYPCMCTNKSKKLEVAKLIKDTKMSKDRGIVISSKYCDMIKLVANNPSFEIRARNFCFNHLANEAFIKYILQKGGYIIGLGWLNNWRENIKTAGFDKDTARRFYHDFSKELIFFDGGFDSNIEKNLKELSEFLDLPYIIIPFDLETTELMIKTAVYEWRLHKSSEQHLKSISQVQAQCAEYSAILDLIGKIASYTNNEIL